MSRELAIQQCLYPFIQNQWAERFNAAVTELRVVRVDEEIEAEGQPQTRHAQCQRSLLHDPVISETLRGYPVTYIQLHRVNRIFDISGLKSETEYPITF